MVKKILVAGVLTATIFMVGCSDSPVPSEDLDKITLAFIEANVYAQGAMVCKPAVITNRTYVGCYNKSLNGQSKITLWLYEDRIFKAINGSARTFAEGHFKGNPAVGVLPVPIPSDIKIDEVLANFRE